MPGLGSSPGGNVQQVSTLNPWGGQQSYLSQNGNPSDTLYGQAYRVGNTPLSFPGFQTYADPTQQQNQAIQRQSDLAINDPTMRAATGGIAPYLNGSMLSAGNPYFGNVVGQLAQSIQPQIDSHFNMNGRAGSGANNQAFASALANTAGQMAYSNYNDQSTNQLKAMLEAPGISQGNFNDIAQLGAAGAQQQAFNQLPITQALNKFQFQQDAPFLQAQRYQSLLGQPVQGGGTNTVPYFTNPAANILGAGSGALSLYNGVNQASNGSLTSGIGSLYSSLFGSGVSQYGDLGGAFSTFPPAG